MEGQLKGSGPLCCELGLLSRDHALWQDSELRVAHVTSAAQPREDTMKKRVAPILAALALTATVAIADDRPDHYRGEASATLAEAFANLAEYNLRLRAILDKGEVQGDDFNEIHRLTYTLENALGRIEDELEALEDDLEELHQGSEKGDGQRIETFAPRYFERAEELLQAAGK